MATAKILDPTSPSHDLKLAIQHAAQLIRRGGLVVFPTETVYGLGANALNAAAVERVYKVKGRPATSPLIVHVASMEGAKALARGWPSTASQLAERYWPGPLTLVLPKQSHIPDQVTAGLPTVGIRMPAHEIALELIRAADVPIAAPSANRFTRLSPTEAAHVRDALDDGVDYILDGGPAPVGIESTVLSLAGDAPVLLRPGMISRSDIEAVIGSVSLAGEPGRAHPSPGMHKRHYSPRTPLHLVSNGDLPAIGRGAYLFLRCPAPAAVAIQMPEQPQDYAATLYRTLHDVDSQGLDWIAVELPPDNPEWLAILDRLQRASS